MIYFINQRTHIPVSYTHLDVYKRQVLALSAGYSLVNTFLIESIFNWPGLGGYTSLSVITSDFPAVLGVTVFAAFCFVVLNLVADLLIAAVDPRVRL